jgi:hypothetical protein
MRLVMRALKLLPLAAIMAAALAPAASAADAFSCTLNGATLLNPPVQTVGGSGYFTFNTNAECAGTVAGVQMQASGVPVAAETVNGSGTFANVICGTGTAQGTATLWRNDVKVTLRFKIRFASGVGYLTFSYDATSATTTTHGNGAGEVTILIDPIPSETRVDCVTTPVSYFTIAGGFTAGDSVPPLPFP